LDTLSSLTGNKIALLIDFDNVILGVEDPGFDVEIVVNALRSRGMVVMGRAYGDWYRHHRHRRKLMEQGIELVETPVFGPLIKNSADIRIVLDGFEIAMSQAHIDTFCLVSGDSDFLPLIKKLQYLGKTVIVIAGIKFTSDLIRRNCNEYISYENLLAESVGATEDVSVIDGAYHLLARSIITLNERLMDVRSSSVKQMMMQLNPAFSERTFGCSQFKQFLDRAARAGVVRLEQRNGGAGESSVYLLEEAKEAMMEVAEATPARALPRATEKPAERGAERRDLSTARRSGRKFVGRANRVENTNDTTPETAAETPTPETENSDAPPAEITAMNVPLASAVLEEFTPAVVPVEGFINVLAQRTDLRRGRLKFSAKTGVARQQAAPGESADVAETVPSVDESSEQTGDTPIEAATLATEETTVKKRATRRGGRGRKKKDEVAEDGELEASPEAPTAADETPVEAATVEATVSQEVAAEPVAEPAPAKPAPRKRLRGKSARTTSETPSEATLETAAAETVTETPAAVDAAAEPSDVASTDAAEEKKPRRRGGVKRAPRKKKDDTPESA
jgi:uncharacterized protein (TIGR00288 family)